MSSIHVFPDPDTLAESIALRFLCEANQAVKDNRFFSLVLTGGATAVKVYRWFAEPRFRDKIPWKSVHLFWTDERCVPPESEESNFGMAQRVFLDTIAIPDKNVHRIRGEEDPLIEAKRYSCEIQNHIVLKRNSKHCFDWILMGLGIDGHTASIFPGKEYLLSMPELCSAVKHPQTSQERITLTGSAFQQAACITYHVIGLDKAEIVYDLISKSTNSRKLPAAHVSGEWYLDHAAAYNLENHYMD